MRLHFRKKQKKKSDWSEIEMRIEAKKSLPCKTLQINKYQWLIGSDLEINFHDSGSLCLYFISLNFYAKNIEKKNLKYCQ